MDLFNLRDLMAEAEKAGQAYLEFLRVASLSAGLYRLAAGAQDEQRPHAEDEFYYVLHGRATFQVGAEERGVEPGTILYVPACAEHRFREIREDLVVLVLFAPAEGSRAVVLGPD